MLPTTKTDSCCPAPALPETRTALTNPDTTQATGRLEGWLWIVIAALGCVAYSNLPAFADWGASRLGLDPHSRLGAAVRFFLYDTPKVLLLLAGVVFVMGMIETFFSAQRTRALLTGKRTGIGNILAASLGIVTPFCSCSAVPLFIGFLSAGVPLGVTFSFLIAAPMINEVALGLLFALFGWKVAVLYLIMGLLIAIFSGLIIGHLRLESHLESWVRDLHEGKTRLFDDKHQMTWQHRIAAGLSHCKSIIGKIWPFVVFGIAIGAAIHGYVPNEMLVSFMGKEVWWGVPAAVLLGIPMYASAAGMIPVVQALIGKGAALGTALAFMMSVTALSAPEMIILRRVLKPTLIATFTGIVASGILLVGYLFNALL